ncbi:hypothetical protein tpqmel_0007 [Candidatus Gastranaerophilus sp. (ex Termes propinquus)]|nr:hypothetical protein tpqmel_0007 [Candidatus Gastranaerophilus sp. (ex Termes propinquus)]
MAYAKVALNRVFVGFRAPLMFERTGETLDIRPIAQTIMVISIAVATLMDARVTVECFPATITEPVPIKTFPKFPAKIGKERVRSSLKYRKCFLIYVVKFFTRSGIL